MSNAYLESTLLGACPELRPAWEARRRSAASSSADPDDAALLDEVRGHAVGLLAAGRVAEFARLARVLERLLAEADPVLHLLLLDGLVRPLARDARDAGIPEGHVAPHLGRRLALAWDSPI
jgi:hypothetical protein